VRVNKGRASAETRLNVHGGAGGCVCAGKGLPHPV
jgi:hypothetical protein